MVNKGSLNILGTFLLASLVLIVVSLNVKNQLTFEHYEKRKEIQEETILKNIHFYGVEKNKPSLFLDATYLHAYDDSRVIFTDPRGYLFSDDDKKIFYKANSGEYLKEKEILELKGEVEATQEQSKHLSHEFEYNIAKKIIKTKGDTYTETITQNTMDTIKTWADRSTTFVDQKRYHFEGNTRGVLIKKKKYEDGMKFDSHEMEIDQLASLVTLLNNVNIFHKDYHFKALKAEIFLENYNKKLKYYVLYDDVVLEEKLQQEDGSIIYRRAFSERLDGFRREEKIVLTGSPRVIQGKDVIKGNVITLRENVKTVEVDDSQSSIILNNDKKKRRN